MAQIKDIQIVLSNEKTLSLSKGLKALANPFTKTAELFKKNWQICKKCWLCFHITFC